jgi:hypothetical protein
MTQHQRRRLFWVMVFFFLLAAPLISLWSQGYRFDWRRRMLTQVGGLYVKTMPRDVKLTILEIGSRTINPTLFSEGYLWNNLLPGNYEIKISKEGYINWTKSAIIQPLKVTKFSTVLLFPETPTLNPLGNIRASDFWVSKETQNALYLADETKKQLYILDLARREPQPSPIIEKGGLAPLRSKILEVVPSPDNSALLIKLADDILIFRRNTKEIFSLFSYVRRLGLKADNFTTLLWNPSSTAELVAVTRGQIYLINIAGSKYRRLMTNDVLLGMDSSGSLILGETGNLYRPGGAEGIEQIDRIIIKPPQNKMQFNIEMLAGRRYLLLDKNGNLWQADSGSELKLIAKNILAFWLNPNKSKAAILSKDQTLSLYLPIEERGDVVYPAGTTLKLGLVEKIPKDVFWLKDGWHLLLRYPEKLEVIEIDSRLPIYRVSYPIIATKAAWLGAENALVYLSQDALWLWRLP